MKIKEFKRKKHKKLFSSRGNFEDTMKLTILHKKNEENQQQKIYDRI